MDTSNNNLLTLTTSNMDNISLLCDQVSNSKSIIICNKDSLENIKKIITFLKFCETYKWKKYTLPMKIEDDVDINDLIPKIDYAQIIENNVIEIYINKLTYKLHIDFNKLSYVHAILNITGQHIDINLSAFKYNITIKHDSFNKDNCIRNINCENLTIEFNSKINNIYNMGIDWKFKYLKIVASKLNANMVNFINNINNNLENLHLNIANANLMTTIKNPNINSLSIFCNYNRGDALSSQFIIDNFPNLKILRLDSLILNNINLLYNCLNLKYIYDDSNPLAQYKLEENIIAHINDGRTIKCYIHLTDVDQMNNLIVKYGYDLINKFIIYLSDVVGSIDSFKITNNFKKYSKKLSKLSKRNKFIIDSNVWIDTLYY